MSTGLNFSTKNPLEEWMDLFKDKGKLSSKDLGSLISTLQKEQNKVKAEEKEAERKRKEEEKKRKEEEERKKQEQHVKEVTSMDLPMDWENVFDSDKRTEGIHVDSISDALIYSLSNLGKVDIEYMSSITGEDYKTIISTLKGSIYQNPKTWNEVFYKGWETSEEYLSGNLVDKWKAAKEANEKYHGYFRENIEAIEKVLPPQVATKDIYITLGSPWVPADIIDDFIKHLFGTAPFENWYLPSSERQKEINESYMVKHDPITGTWEIPDKQRYGYENVLVHETYGTKEMNALYILEKTLNMQTVAVKKTIKCPTNKSGTKRVVDPDETAVVLEKQKKIIDNFKKWVWKSPERKERLQIIFENQFSCVKTRKFDGSFLNFPGLSPNVELYPYQKNAVARIIFTPNTLLAHDVGAGKTYVMIAAGQELKRMGLSKKNMYVVPNNIVGQWKKIFLEMYPNAKLRVIEPKDFKLEKREAVLQDIKRKRYDGIIIAYSCFERIPLSKDYYKKELEDRKKTIEDALNKKSHATSKLRSKKKKINEALWKLESAMDDLYDMPYFDELGITRLFVDEAHNFKNVPIETKIDQVLGISKNGSKKCQDMMDKVKMVQKQNDGGGVVFATGTPITNSVTDAFVMQKYLQSGMLGMLDIQNFDSWVGMFAEKNTQFEIDVDTSSYRLTTRFSKFHNLPELTSLLAQVADFHSVDKSVGIPDLDGYTDAVISKSTEFKDYLKNISRRADMVRKGVVYRTQDNMLKITTDGRKAALDIRLVTKKPVYSNQFKVTRCAENVADIYHKTSQDRSTQLIFCDISTPKDKFNIYDELRRQLNHLGVKDEEIAYIHDATTESKRNALFKEMRNGDIRVLIGSTFKLGLGVNVQDKLIAMHHIDVPWRPADMTQREGRILRQGNENDKVQIFRYITEGSFDAYSWQLLETKQRFIQDLLSGSLNERSGTDVDDTALNYAEVKALAVGNPLVKERVETANELNRFMTLQRKHVESRLELENELRELPSRIENLSKKIENAKEDKSFFTNKKAQDREETEQKLNDGRLTKKDIENERKNLREQLDAGIKANVLATKEKEILKYEGFDVCTPANMSKEKPGIYLKRKGKYYVELGNTEVGNLIRLDNFLNSMDDYIEELQENLQKMKTRQTEIKKELGKTTNYSRQIMQLKKQIKNIDHKLGVDEKK